MIHALLIAWLLFIIPPEVIAGEASLCGLEGRLAVAHVASRNGRWTGWENPTPLDIHVARHWDRYPDPTRGSRFLFSDQDLMRADVQSLIAGRETGRIPCKYGLGLNYVPEEEGRIRVIFWIPKAR